MEHTFFVWLNRIGIIFNLAAGFMVAPELIGFERLKKIELTLNNRLSYLQILFKNTLSKTLYQFKKMLPTSISVGIIIIGFVVTPFFNYFNSLLLNLGLPLTKNNLSTIEGVIIVVIWAILVLYNKNWLERKTGTKYTDRTIIEEKLFLLPDRIKKIRHTLLRVPLQIFFLIVFIPLTPFIILIEIMWIILLLLVLVPSAILYPLINKVTEKLQGEDRLKPILVSNGIILFIAGNLFQLIATK